MALVNIGSLVAFSAHRKAVWAIKLIAAMDPLLIVLVGVGLITAHVLFSRWRRRTSASHSNSSAVQPSKWAALLYIVTSVAVFMYASSLLPVPHS